MITFYLFFLQSKSSIGTDITIVKGKLAKLVISFSYYYPIISGVST